MYVWIFAGGLATGLALVYVLHKLLEVDDLIMANNLNDPDEHSV